MNAQTPPIAPVPIASDPLTGKTMAMPCTIVIRVIAAGVTNAKMKGEKPKLRLSLSLTPIPCDQDKATVDLARWPLAIDGIWPATKDGSPGPNAARLKIVCLNKKGWRGLAENGAQDSKEISIGRKINPHCDGSKANQIWQEAMGDDPCFASLATACKQNNAKTTLDKLFSSGESTPVIHGTDRGVVAVDLAFERAFHILASLTGVDRETRPAPAEIDGDQKKVKDALDALLLYLDPLNPKDDPGSSTREALALKSDLAHVDARLQSFPPKKKIDGQDARLASIKSLLESRSKQEPARIKQDVYPNGVEGDGQFLNDRLSLETIILDRLAQEKTKKTLDDRKEDAKKWAEARATYLNPTHQSKAAIEKLAEAVHANEIGAPRETAEKYENAKGNNDIKPETEYARAVFRASSSTGPAASTDESEALARRRLYTVFSYPSLARLFGFVIDTVVSIDDLKPDESGMLESADVRDVDMAAGAMAVTTPIGSGADRGSVWYLAMSLDLGKSPGHREIWCTAKLRFSKGSLTAHFLPCTREEIDSKLAPAKLTEAVGMAINEQLDGIVNLGQAGGKGKRQQSRFDIVTLDTVASTAADEHLDMVRRQNQLVFDKSKDPKKPPPPEERQRATLRTSGLALIDRWRRNHSIDRAVIAKSQHDPSARVLLDANDLTIGYRLDVGVKSRADGAKDRRRWHTLMARKLSFSRLAKKEAPLEALINGFYFDAESRRRCDGGLLTVPTAFNDSMAFAEEIVGAWRGDPLGLATGQVMQQLSPKDLRINIAASLPTNDEEDAYTPPPLRFGWRYHFAMRAVYPGGIDMPLTRALAHYENSYARSLALPSTAQSGRSYRRQERIETPQVLLPLSALGTIDATGTVSLQGRYPTPQGLRMIVRKLKREENCLLAKTPASNDDLEGLGIARRLVLPPPVALDFASAHGMFDRADYEFEAHPDLLQPRLVPEEVNAKSPVQTVLDPGEGHTFEWVPRAGDPTERGSGDVWSIACVAWRHTPVKSRPRGGLKGIDHHATWGGFPVFQPKPVASSAPCFSKEVVRPSGSVTDSGRILDRRDDVAQHQGGGAPADVTSKDWIQNQTWNAAAGPPQGDAVFRLLDPKRAKESPRDPFYPDPAAEHMVIQVEIAGSKPAPSVRVPLYRGPIVGPSPKDYPDVVPVCLDLLRVDARKGKPLVELAAPLSSLDAQGVIKSWSIGASITKSLSKTQAIDVRRVIIRLEPGEAAKVRIWCLPSAVFLKRIFEGTETIAVMAVCKGAKAGEELATLDAQDRACRAGFKTLSGLDLPPVPKSDALKRKVPNGPAFGGLPVGSEANLEAITTSLLKTMSERPVPEIAATLELEAVYAIDRPLEVPTLIAATVPATGWPAFPLMRTDRTVESDMLKIKPAKDQDLVDRLAKGTEVEGQKPGATGILLGGKIKIHAPSSGAIEIQAAGPAALRGHFDDIERGRSRDDRARGLWPKPGGQDIEPLRLFGFCPDRDGLVSFKREKVTLLRVDGFPPTSNEIDLIGHQGVAYRSLLQDAEDGDTSLRCERPLAFSDGRARWLEFYAVAIARHGALLATRYGEQASTLVNPMPEEAKPIAKQWLPATVRPARISPLSIVPSFKWEKHQKAEARDLLEVSFTRKSFARVRIRRPWFSSGEDERIGVVLWPPNIFSPGALDPKDPDRVQPLAPQAREFIDLANLPTDGGDNSWQQLQDNDLGPGGAWVSRWGADPIKVDNEIKGWLLIPDSFDESHEISEANWNADPTSSKAPGDGIRVSHALMPLPVSQDAEPSQSAVPLGGFMSVALLVYRARFDPAAEHWYADVPICPQTALEPFVRLGLVRYQPHAPSALRLSEPIAEWTKLLPDRTITVKRCERKTTGPHPETLVEIEATLFGSARETLLTDDEDMPPPRVVMTLLRADEDGVQFVVGCRDNIATVKPESAARLRWTYCFKEEANPDFRIFASDFDDPKIHWAVHVEEVDLLRPATYPDEPRYYTKTDDVFAPTGPRTMGLACLDGLKKTKM